MSFLLQLAKTVIPIIADTAKKSITTKFEENVSSIAVKNITNATIDCIFDFGLQKLESECNGHTKTPINIQPVPSNHYSNQQYQILQSEPIKREQIPKYSALRQNILSDQYKYNIGV